MNAILALLFLLPLTTASGQTTRLLTAPGNQESESSCALSADARFVALASRATNLVPSDTNTREDVFVRDRALGTIERISIATGGAQGDGSSNSPSLDASGRYVVFQSEATNIDGGDANFGSDIFLRDRLLAITARVSVAHGGGPANDRSADPQISADGRFVAFWSYATDILPPGANTHGVTQVYLRDLLANTTQLVSSDSTDAPANGFSLSPAVSGDGHYVAFASAAPNLIPGDAGGGSYVWDRLTHTTIRADRNSSGAIGDGGAGRTSISWNGRWVAFSSTSTNLVPNDTNGWSDVFVRDLRAGTTACASLAGAATGDLTSDVPTISPSGRYVAFRSLATNLIVGDTNGLGDVYRRDMLTGAVERVSVSTAGAEGNDLSGAYQPAVSGDGRAVVFTSRASNLVAGDANGAADFFVRTLP